MNPSLKSNNLLKHLAKLRVTFTYIYWLIIKDITKDIEEQPDKEVNR